MALNLFGKKKKEEPKERVAVHKAQGGALGQKREVNVSRLNSVLLNPLVTEKASILAEKGRYVFRVHPSASKGSVKESVEAAYGVAVKKVNLLGKPAKKIRVGKRQGVKSGMKKAVVELQKGETIEVISR